MIQSIFVLRFDTKRIEVLLSMREAPKDDILESTYQTELRDFGTIEDHICSFQSRYSTEERISKLHALEEYGQKVQKWLPRGQCSGGESFHA